MFRNYLKTTYRNLKGNKLYSMINISGLALGLSICFIITLWIQRELSYDRFHSKADRIYRVERELFRDNLYSRWPIGSGQYKRLLLDDYPEIESAVRFWRNEFAVRDFKNNIRRLPLFAVDNSVFEIFDFGLELGDEKTALTEPKTIVLTRENALKYLGRDDVIGRSLTFEWAGEPVDFKVTGILREVPENSHIHFGALISISSYPDETFASLRSNNLYIYILVREGVSQKVTEEKMMTFVENRLGPVYGDLLVSGLSIHEVLKVHLFPITGIHLHPAENWEAEPGGSVQSVYIFSTIAAFILILACVNFINLSTARAGKRAKEVSLRKTVGAGKNQLRAQFIQESTQSAFISLAAALVLCYLFIPLFHRIFAVQISFGSLLQPRNLIFMVGTTLAAGILSGIYPAFYLTRFDPAVILKGGSTTGKGRSALRKNMVVFQFAISTTLIFGMLTVFLQMRFVQTRSLGFNKDNVIVIPARTRQVFQSYESFRSELIQNAKVVSVSASTDLPGDPLYANSAVTRKDSNEPINLIFFSCDYDYVETLKLEIEAGRDFSREFSADMDRSVMLNQAAAKRIGWTPEEAVGKQLNWPGANMVLDVIGVVKDFNFKSLRTEVEPIIIRQISNAITFISVRIVPGAIEATLDFIRGKWEGSFPGEQFDYTFLDSRIQDLYNQERRMLHLFLVFSALSIFVACLGLFGLAAFTAEAKTKEIGIRKTLGASAGSVTFLFSKEFVKWILIADVIACPLAWYMMNQWLHNFAYRIHISGMIFVSTILITLLTALFSFIFQALKAAWANPVDSLRYE